MRAEAPESRIDAVDAFRRAGAILGKHDKAAAVPQDRPELLHTGPIAIRGVGRATRDFFRPDKVNRHRLSPEERAAAARAAEQDATETEQLDAAEIAAAAERAGEDSAAREPVPVTRRLSAFGVLPTAADQDDRIPTTQIPLTWMFSDPSVDLGAAGPVGGHAEREQPVHLMPEFPTALDAAAVEELQRRVLQRARGIEEKAPTGGAERIFLDESPGTETGAAVPAEHRSDVEQEEHPDLAGGSVAAAEPRKETSDPSPEDLAGEAEDVTQAIPMGEDSEMGRPLDGLDTEPVSEEAHVVVDDTPRQEEAPPLLGSQESEEEQVARDVSSAAPMDTDKGEHLSDVLQAPLETERGSEAEEQLPDAAEPVPESQPGPGDEQYASPGHALDDVSSADAGEVEPVAPLVHETGEEVGPLDPGNEILLVASERTDYAQLGEESPLPAQDAAQDLPSSVTEVIKVTSDGVAVLEPKPDSAESEAVEPAETPTNSDDTIDAHDAPAALSEPPAGVELDDSPSQVGAEQQDASLSTPAVDLDGEGDPGPGPGQVDAVGPSASEAVDGSEPSVPRPLPESLVDETGISPGNVGLLEHDELSSEVPEAPSPVAPVGDTVDELEVGEQPATSTDVHGEHDVRGGVASALRPESSAWFEQTDHATEPHGGVVPSSAVDEDSTERSSRDEPDRQSSLPSGDEPAGGSETNDHEQGGVEPPSTAGDSQEAERTETPPASRATTEPSGAPTTDAAERQQDESPARSGEAGEGLPAAQPRPHPPTPEVEPAIATALAVGLRPVDELVEGPERPSKGRPPKADRPPGPKSEKQGQRSPGPPREARVLRVGSRDGGGRILGYVGLLALMLVTTGLVTAVIAKTHDDAALAAKEAAAYTAPPLAVPSAPSNVPVVSVVGDDLSTGSISDSGPKSEWPALLASALHAEVKTFAAAGAGYVAKGAGGATLVTEAARVDPASTVVVLFGGGNDVSSSPLTVVTAATKAISTVQQAAPKAKIVVVGPASAETTPSPALLAVRDSLQAAARIAKVEWQDPLASNWLSSSSLTTTSGVPNDAGEKALESKLYAALRSLTKA